MPDFEVKAPVKDFTGQVAGIGFRAGSATVNDGNDAGRAALAYFKRAGYRVDEVHDDEQDGPQTPPAGDAESFDPSDHKADEVLTFLAAASYEDAVRVLDAEAEGKKRVTITSARDEILAAKTPTTPAAADDDQKGPQA